jgi:hypothetical protein
MLCPNSKPALRKWRLNKTAMNLDKRSVAEVLNEEKNDAALKYDLQYGFHKNNKAEKISDSIDISSDWDINFNPEMGGPKSFRLEKLISWSEVDEKGIKYYSGSATFTRNFLIKKDLLSKGTEAYVKFGDIQEMARVFINGSDCGIVWTPPYKALITPFLKAGNNTISVQVINAWNNRIVGDFLNPEGKAYTRTNIKNKFIKKSSLLNSGLMGRAEIFFK